MPAITTPLPGLGKPYYNVDSTSLTSNCELVRDGYIDEFGAFHKRPGFKLFSDLGTSEKVDGVYSSDNEDLGIYVSNGNIFKGTDKYGAKTDITGDKLTVGTRVSFDEIRSGGSNYLFMANNCTPIFTNFTSNTQKLSTTSTPPLTGSGTPPSNCTHIIKFFSYLIGNNQGSESWAFSYPGDPFRWDAADSYDHTDQQNVLGIYKGSNFFTVCGRSLLDVWVNSQTPKDPFLSPMKAQYNQVGLSSPYAVSVIEGNKLIFLDKTRRIVLIEGNSFIDMGLPINKELQNLTTVADANAFTMAIDGRSFYIISFPQDKRTFAYDFISKAWYEWSYWDESSASYGIFRANCYTYSHAWNKHLIGDISNGKIYEMDSDHYTDDGSVINAEIITGHVNYGSDAILKRPKSVVARIKRGVGKEGALYEVPKMFIRHRDNGESQWSNLKEISLGAVGDTEFRVVLYQSTGQYYTRQYNIKMPDPTRFVLSGIWEEF